MDRKQGSRKKEVTMRQIGLNSKNLDSGDVFILDTDQTIFQWNGSGSDQNERFEASKYVRELCEQRNGKPKKVVLDDPDVDEDFMAFFSDEAVIDERYEPEDVATHVVKRLSDASGELKIDDVAVADGKVTPSLLDSNDVFIVDKRGGPCYVWFGKGASAAEARNWSMYAHNYLVDAPNKTKHVQTVKEGKEPAGFFDWSIRTMGAWI